MAKANKKQALGRGLSALLREKKDPISSNDQVVGNIVEIDLETIEVNPYQPRTHFDQEALQELASSIKELGVIQPITVRKVDDVFQLVSGERRFRASKLIGNKSIPAYIRIANDQEILEMALVENIQRKNLDPIEIALSYQRLIDEIQLTQEELSIKVGKKRSTVTNYLRLLKLDPIIQTGIRDGFISMGHGRAIINIDQSKVQLDVYERILKKKLSVRQTEELVQSLKNRLSSKKLNKKSTPKYIEDGITEFNSIIGHKINVTVNAKGKGKISIPFHSREDFERIKNLLK